MKQISFLFLLLLFCLLLSACGNSQTEKAPALAKDYPAADHFRSPVTSVPPEEIDEGFSSPELNVLEGIEVELKDSETELNIPADFIGPVTQEDLSQIASDAGYSYATLNEDGSVTMRMSPSQHLELLEGLADYINERLEDMTVSGEYPAFGEISADKDFTVFTIVLSSEKQETSNSLSAMTFFMYGKLYAAFSGKEPEPIHVEYVSGDSGRVIEVFVSSDIPTSDTP